MRRLNQQQNFQLGLMYPFFETKKSSIHFTKNFIRNGYVRKHFGLQRGKLQLLRMYIYMKVFIL